MVLELARDGAVDRPVPGVVDARRELVREQPPVDLEQLDGQHADVAERVQKLARDLLCLRLRRVGRGSARDRRGSRRDAVLGERVEDAFRRRDRARRRSKLAIERNDLLRELVGAERARATRRRAALCRRSRSDATSRAPAAPLSSSDPKRAVGMPSLQKSSFSTRRSCPCSSARASGSARRRRAASTGTFSNSYVTTSAPSARRSRSSGSSYGADDELADLARARVGGGSRKRNRTPSGSRRAPSMRPSWPPPMQPTRAVTPRDRARRARLGLLAR